MADLPIVCPAGASAHPAVGSASVHCGVLAASNRGAHVGGFTSRGQVSPIRSGDEDRLAVHTYCCGTGVPGALNSYDACPIWRAAKEAEWAARRGPDALRDKQATRPPDIDPELREFVRLSAGG